jgi:hypothetical protein
MVSQDKFDLDTIYLLPYCWIIIALPCLKLWQIKKMKTLVLLHLLALYTFAFSYILYFTYLELMPKTSFKTEMFTEVNNLMFASENKLYVAFYLGVAAIIIDIIYYTNKLKQKDN